MRRSVVPGGPHPCTGQFEVFLEPATESRDERRTREDAAKTVCGTCDARPDCLAIALANRERHDVWGGLNPDERADLASRLPRRVS